MSRYPPPLAVGSARELGGRALACIPQMRFCENRFLRWMCLFRLKPSTCCQAYKNKFELTICSYPTIDVLSSNISDGWSVMYVGKLVEHATPAETIHQSRHPYRSVALRRYQADHAGGQMPIVLQGDVADPANRLWLLIPPHVAGIASIAAKLTPSLR
jgi:ABC-type antimicrobial peptide transport system ATPase subunit